VPVKLLLPSSLIASVQHVLPKAHDIITTRNLQRRQIPSACKRYHRQLSSQRVYVQITNKKSHNTRSHTALVAPQSYTFVNALKRRSSVGTVPANRFCANCLTHEFISTTPCTTHRIFNNVNKPISLGTVPLTLVSNKLLKPVDTSIKAKQSRTKWCAPTYSKVNPVNKPTSVLNVPFKPKPYKILRQRTCSLSHERLKLLQRSNIAIWRGTMNSTIWNARPHASDGLHHKRAVRSTEAA
jgi:hypothetical protein